MLHCNDMTPAVEAAETISKTARYRKTDRPIPATGPDAQHGNLVESIKESGIDGTPDRSERPK